MGPKRIPANLSVTEAYLTDTPYEVQLSVLRWIRVLLSGVVDDAVSQASTNAKSPQQQKQQQHHLQQQDADSACPGDDPLIIRVDMPEKDGADIHLGSDVPVDSEAQAGEGSAAEDVATSVDECLKACTSIVDTLEEESVPATASDETGISRRKRPRAPSLIETNLFTAGSVVECFHPDDGLWYPATVTAVVSSPVLTPSPHHVEGVHGFVVVGEGEGDGVDIPTGKVLASNSQEGKLLEQLLEVTFLGYGNMSTVPFDWAREIETPEVLQWCQDNGIEPWTKSASTHAEDDERAAESPTPSPGVRVDSAQLVPVQSDPVQNDQAGNGSGNEAGGEQVYAGREATTNQMRQTHQQTNQQGKKGAGKKNKKSNKWNKKGGTARGKNQSGVSEKEDEERLLMRCASRSRSPLAHVPSKYWAQRYRYFSRFDEGVGMDEEGWYSVTPEAIALHIAERVCCDIIVDPFVGCGGNAVQFALVCHLVFAIDLDPVKLEHARRNAAIYGVENRIEFILGDAMTVLPTLKADAVFLSPPWGGPAYNASDTFDLHTMIPSPLTALDMFRAARQVTPNVVFFLPRNVDFIQVAGLPAAALAAASVGEGRGEGEGQGEGKAVERCELEKQFLNGKLKTTTAYFGPDIVAARGNKNKNKKTARNGGGKAKARGEDNVPAAPANSDARSAVAVEWDGGGGGSIVAVRAPAWAGRHVRFSDDDDGKALAVEHEREEPVLSSRSRENALYESWMAAAVVPG